MEYTKDYYIHNFKLKPVSEFDEALLNKGTSIYEVVRIEQGIAIFLEGHLNRLFHSAEISRLNLNESYCDIETLIAELIRKNNTNQGKIKVVARFKKGNGLKENDLFIYFTPHYFPSEDEYTSGVKVGLCYAVRPNPNAKILNTEARKKANSTIAEEKIFEVLLMNKKGFITEGSRSNIFFIKGSQVITPPEKDVLNGITRRNILKLCKKNHIQVEEKKIHYSEIGEMDSMFLSGTSLKVLPVKYFETSLFNTTNTILKRIMELYNLSINDYILSKK